MEMKKGETLSGRILGRFAWLQALVGGIILSGITLVIVYGMVMRYALRKPVGWSIEVPQLFFLVIIALGLAYTQVTRGHVRVEFVVTRLPAGAQRILELLSLVFFMAYAIFFIWAGWTYAVSDLHYGARSMLAKIPLFSIEVLLPLGVASLCLLLTLDIVQSIMSLRRRDDNV